MLLKFGKCCGERTSNIYFVLCCLTETGISYFPNAASAFLHRLFLSYSPPSFFFSFRLCGYLMLLQLSLQKNIQALITSSDMELYPVQSFWFVCFFFPTVFIYLDVAVFFGFKILVSLNNRNSQLMSRIFQTDVNILPCYFPVCCPCYLYSCQEEVGFCCICFVTDLFLFLLGQR